MNERCPNNEDGTVLLSTLLVLTLMSAVALGLLATVRGSVIRATTLDARAQADLYVQGARDFVGSQLDAYRTVQGAQLNALLTDLEPFILPFDNGSIEMRLTEGTHCFRLSALANANGEAQDTERLIFVSLMTSLGIDSSRAMRIAASAVDWVDADSQALPMGAEDGPYLSRPKPQGGPHRTANTGMQSVTELRAVNGMDEALFQTLLPYLCIGEEGAPTTFNIDSAQPWNAPVLAALLGGGTDADPLAQALIEGRPSGGYGSLDTLLASPSLSGYDTSGMQTDAIVFSPARVTAETIITYADIRRAQLLAYEGVDRGRLTLTYRSDGWDEFPSLARARLLADEEDRAR